MQQGKEKKVRPPQKQKKPGIEAKMRPAPVYDREKVKGSGKLEDKVAIITGGDSGIGRAVAILFAKEGADVTVVYLKEDEDAKATQQEIEKYGRKCLLISGDLTKERFHDKIVSKTLDEFGKIDILVNNAAGHWETDSLEDISTKQLLQTFTTNVFAYFWLTKTVLPHLKKGSAIINTTSVTAYRGSNHLLDYASSKGAIVSFTRSLAQNLVKTGIRVNAVAPGPIWTPLIVSSFPPEEVAKFGTDAPMGRAGEPVEVAPCYLFLASEDSSYMTGQVLHPNGGEIVNG